jgi:hypothetical protein
LVQADWPAIQWYFYSPLLCAYITLKNIFQNTLSQYAQGGQHSIDILVLEKLL